MTDKEKLETVFKEIGIGYQPSDFSLCIRSVTGDRYYFTFDKDGKYRSFVR